MAAAAVNNASFTSPVANADYSASLDAVTGGLLSRVYDGMSGFNLFLSLLLILVAYDQCEFLCARSNNRSRCHRSRASWADSNTQLNMCGTRAVSLDRHGRLPSSGPFFPPYTRRWMSTRPNGQVGI